MRLAGASRTKIYHTCADSEAGADFGAIEKKYKHAPLPAVEPSLDGIGRIVAAPQAHAPPPQAYAPPAAPQAQRPLEDVEFVIREPQHPLPAGAFGSGLQHARDVGAARALKVLPESHTTNYEASRAIVTHRPYNAAPPPATDWDAPAPYKGNLAMLLQAMIAVGDAASP